MTFKAVNLWKEQICAPYKRCTGQNFTTKSSGDRKKNTSLKRQHFAECVYLYSDVVQLNRWLVDRHSNLFTVKC